MENKYTLDIPNINLNAIESNDLVLLEEHLKSTVIPQFKINQVQRTDRQNVFAAVVKAVRSGCENQEQAVRQQAIAFFGNIIDTHCKHFGPLASQQLKMQFYEDFCKIVDCVVEYKNIENFE